MYGSFSSVKIYCLSAVQARLTGYRRWAVPPAARPHRTRGPAWAPSEVGGDFDAPAFLRCSDPAHPRHQNEGGASGAPNLLTSMGGVPLSAARGVTPHAPSPESPPHFGARVHGVSVFVLFRFQVCRGSAKAEGAKVIEQQQSINPALGQCICDTFVLLV